MATTKKTAKAKPKAARKVEPEQPSGFVSVIHLKGTTELREWLAGVSKKTHIPAAAITRLAYIEWAEKNGHPAPPER